MMLTKSGAHLEVTAAPKTAIVRLHLDEDRALGKISPQFTGLGYEISSVSTSGLLSASNSVYVQLVRTLGKQGVIRVGGNTSDYSSFAPQGQAASSAKASVVNQANLRDLRSFLDATGWQLIWGLNLGKGTEKDALEEALAVYQIAGDKLLAFEIGNEPDLFSHEGHRAKGYRYDDYLKEYHRYKAVIRASLPQSRFAGPDAAGMNDWTTRFAADEGNDLVLLTHHYYREGQNPTSTLAKLFNPDPRLEAMLATLREASKTSDVPFRICETNSFSGGGRPGVSDTFGSALWAMDYLCMLAWGGADGVNMETGVNQLDFVSYYSPLDDDTHGHYRAAPEYYGMLAFAQVCGGVRLSLDYDAGGMSFKAYAARVDLGHVVAVLLNKETSRDIEVEIVCKKPLSHASAIRLTAPSPESKDGVTLGGAAVSANGEWSPKNVEPVSISHGSCKVLLRAGSGALIDLHQ
jgi:hypothetical protein